MTYRVTGFAEGVPYSVEVSDAGAVSGSERVERVLLAHEGEAFAPTPTHGRITLASGDPRSIFVALHHLTAVTSTGGDTPDVIDDNDDVHDENRVY